jgi:ATP-dependent RNA helicase DeaD
VIEPDFVDALGPALAGALDRRGFTELTPVQKTVLDPAVAGSDLRMTSQTGSGKTVAIGFALRDLAAQPASSMGGVAHPHAIVIAPTRELAKQVDEELTWLYAPLGTHVVSVTGGASTRDERRALASGPAIIVGTPGRLLDHMDRGAIDASEVGAVVLDEADRLLDMGFREELEAILAHTPEERRTHLVSATFPREVRALADAVQRDPVHVEGTRLGEANADIEHVLHLVDGRDRLGAIINLLLRYPDDQTLVFARTRADVGEIAEALSAAGFPASSLSGEMEQAQRDRAMAAFRRGDLRVLVATDVAARGIDVQDIARVLHADPPGDADTYTHRSGRTGRAGRKGVSATLVPPSVMGRVVRLLHQARVPFHFEVLPSARDIREAQDAHLFEELTRAEAEGDAPLDERARALAERLAAAPDVPRTIARLLLRARQALGPEPREIRYIEPPSDVARPTRRGARRAEGESAATARGRYGAQRPAREVAERPAREARAHRTREAAAPLDREGAERPERDFSQAPASELSQAPANEQAVREASQERASEPMEAPESSQRPPRVPSQRGPRDLQRPWTLFQVSWGEAHGADSRRMLAMLCRRGGIESSDVGSIRIGTGASTVEIDSGVADRFAEAAGKTDLRDPRIVIRPMQSGAPAREPRGAAPPRFRSAPPPRGSSPPPRFGSSPPPRFGSSPPPPRARPHHVDEEAPDEAAPRAARAPKAARPKPRVTAKDKPFAKGKGWVKKPAARAAHGGGAPPKRPRA